MGLDMYLTCNIRPLALAIKNRADDLAGTLDEPDWHVKFFYQASW